MAAPPTAVADPLQTKSAAPGDYYFDSYSHYGIHMEMLKDRCRTESYRNAILMNPYMFKGKTVLDVGCGTGILSMFAAQAGARKVIGIDCSSVAVQARQIVKDNGYENVITILQGRVEELTLPPEDVPDGKVDIIISEWMGYFLLYESMLNTVLYARDKWGTKEVKILPDKSNMYVCGINDASYREDRFDCWDDVHGFNFSHFKRLAHIEPLIDNVDRNQLVTDTALLYKFDLNTVKEAELAFTSTFSLTAHRSEVLHALSVHFDTPFTAGHEKITLDTAPWVVPTHWRQTVFYLFNAIKIEKGERILFTMSSMPNSGNPRDLDIHLRVDFDGVHQKSHFDQDFRVR